MQELLILRKDAFKQGIEIRQNLEETYQEFYTIQNEVEGYHATLIQMEVDFNSFRDQWSERLRDLNLKIGDAELKLTTLQKRLQISRTVLSPVAGTVADIQAAVGSIINEGIPLVSIASDGEGIDALIYMASQNGKRVKPGMTALIFPNTVEKEEFGGIQGEVISVSAFPTTAQAMLSYLQNQELVKSLTSTEHSTEAPIAVRVHLLNDANTFSGLKWSSSKGPKQLITPGTVVNANITIRKQAPITLVIPVLKQVTGIQ